MPEPTPNTVPSDEDLRLALISLRAENPTLGVPKLHALLLSSHPWTVSEKRSRKILQTEGLVLSASSDDAPKKKTGSKQGSHEDVFPSSSIIENLDVQKWTGKVEVKHFGLMKGKGLIAKEKINEGETVWKEDPFVIAPEWDIFDLQEKAGACAFCTTPFTNSSLVTLTCTASSSTTHCPARFCNRLCLSRSARSHPLLCPARNPAAAPLVQYARRHEWMALHALAQCASRILLAAQQDVETLAADWQVFRGLAVLGMEERFRKASAGREPDRETWKRAHTLFVEAFHEPKSESERKKMAKILRKPISEEMKATLFTYDAFLHGLGKMSLNLEAHGGLYTLHSHLNHSCSPIISVRHLDQRNALARITLIAKQDIEVGEELLVTYVNPGYGVNKRRNHLMEWGFGMCCCARCLAEEKDNEGDGKGVVEMDDLAQELKAGLGVM